MAAAADPSGGLPVWITMTAFSRALSVVAPDTLVAASNSAAGSMIISTGAIDDNTHAGHTRDGAATEGYAIRFGVAP